MGARLIASLVLPAIIWLLYGAPDLALSGNRALMAVIVLHLFAVIWLRPMFRLFRGDDFTYGMLGLSLNLVSFAVTLVAGFVGMRLIHQQLASVHDLPAIIWGMIGLGLAMTAAIPVLTMRSVSPLPKASGRREYEDPTGPN